MKTLFTLGIFIGIAMMARSQETSSGELRGRLYDATTHEGIPFALVVLGADGVQKGYGQTDDDGNYVIKPVFPGSYQLSVRYLGYKNSDIQNVEIVDDRITFQNVVMETASGIVDVEILQMESPGRDRQNTTHYDNCTPSRSNSISADAVVVVPNAVPSLMACVYQRESEPLQISGVRDERTVYYVDGLPVTQPITNSEVERLSVLTGGIPARFENADDWTDYSGLRKSDDPAKKKKSDGFPEF